MKQYKYVQGKEIDWRFAGPGLDEQVNLPVRYFYGAPYQNGTLLLDIDMNGELFIFFIYIFRL